MVVFEVRGTKVSVDFSFDEANANFLGDYKPFFIDFVVSAMNKIYSLNPELIDAPEIKLEIWLNLRKKNTESEQLSFDFNEEESGLKVIGMNLLKLNQQGFNVAVHLKNHVPPEKWFIWREAYGKTLAFSDAIEHEMRHLIDRKLKTFDFLSQKKRIPWIGYGVLRFLDLIRQEAYPKLFDAKSDVIFFHDALAQIKYNLFLAVKLYPLGGKYVEKLSAEDIKKLSWNEKEPWMRFLWKMSPGDQHYYLARYMSFIIAYGLMDKDAVINERLGLKVRDINTAIDKGYPLSQPPSDIKKQAGELIRNSEPEQFLELFENSAKSLGISEGNMPLTKEIFNKLLKEGQENTKMIFNQKYALLIEDWKAKKITFYELKQKISEEPAPA